MHSSHIVPVLNSCKILPICSSWAPQPDFVSSHPMACLLVHIFQHPSTPPVPPMFSCQEVLQVTWSLLSFSWKKEERLGIWLLQSEANNVLFTFSNGKSFKVTSWILWSHDVKALPIPGVLPVWYLEAFAEEAEGGRGEFSFQDSSSPAENTLIALLMLLLSKGNHDLVSISEESRIWQSKWRIVVTWVRQDYWQLFSSQLWWLSAVTTPGTKSNVCLSCWAKLFQLLQ